MSRCTPILPESHRSGRTLVQGFIGCVPNQGAGGWRTPSYQQLICKGMTLGSIQSCRIMASNGITPLTAEPDKFQEEVEGEQQALRDKLAAITAKFLLVFIAINAIMYNCIPTLNRRTRTSLARVWRGSSRRCATGWSTVTAKPCKFFTVFHA